MKKLLFIAAVLVGSVVFTSCSGGYTCPTYMKMDNQKVVKSGEVRV